MAIAASDRKKIWYLVQDVLLSKPIVKLGYHIGSGYFSVNEILALETILL